MPPAARHHATGRRSLARHLALRAALGLVVGTTVAVATWGLDRLTGLTLPLASSTAQSLLAAFVGSVLTIAVFALWMRTVVVGLTSSQVSTRVLTAYLDDRFQQRVLGVMVALFTYLVAATALLPSDTPRTPALTAAVALLAVVTALIGILLSMRDAVASLSLPSVVRTLADGVLELLEIEPAPNDAAPDPRAQHLELRCVVASRELGWVQDIDHEALLAALEPRGTLDLRVEGGGGAAPPPGEPLCRLDGDADEETQNRIRAAFTVTRVRSTRHDLAYAVQQLVDVVESAVAPHSSDTSIAYEALMHLRGVLHVLIRRGTASGCLEGDDGRWVVSSAAWSTVDHLEAVFGRLQAAVDDPAFHWRVHQTTQALLRTAEEIVDDASSTTLRRLCEESAAAAGPSPRRTRDEGPA